MIAKPLHVATIAGHPLRFFGSPLADGRPDLPWHCVDDLHRCLGLDRQARRFFLAQMRRDHGDTLHTIAAASGIVTVAPHFMAQGTVDAMVETGRAPSSARREYDLASTDAMQKVALPPSGTDAWLGWMKAAMHQWEQPA